MIRLLALWMVVLALSMYAWRDWYKALCGLVLLIAVTEHPDMPKTMFGMQGLNPWNLLLAVVLLAWLAHRRRERLVWDMPPHVTWSLLMYLGVMLLGFVRLLADRAGLEDVTTAYLVSECLINTVKWVIPGLLLYDGCRSRERFTIALASLLGAYFLLALQVIRWMPVETAFSGNELTVRSAKILVNEVGFNRVNLATMLAGASWAIAAAAALPVGAFRASLILGGSIVTTYSLVLTAGRAGYIAWMGTGLILCLIRWWRYLAVIPIIVGLVVSLAPGTLERLSQGFDGPETDFYTVTAGRDVAWPLVVAKISEGPFLGFGRLAMERTGLTARLKEEFDEDFGHPHNAYLELLLDNGWVGALCVLPFYAIVLRQSIALFRDRRSRIYAAAGGVTLALVLALLLGGVGSQTFYPREGAVPMWCAIGLLLRVAVDRSRLIRRKAPVRLDSIAKSSTIDTTARPMAAPARKTRLAN
jgi:hypothetical protein